MKKRNKTNKRISEDTDVEISGALTSPVQEQEEPSETAQTISESVESTETESAIALAPAAEIQSGESAEDAQDAITAPPSKVHGDKVLTPKQKRIRTAIRWILINVGIIMMSASVYFFQVPNNFTLGGVAGIAILLAKFIPLSQAVIMAIINVFLLILGLIILGKQCTLKTIYCSLLYTGIIWLFEFVDLMGIITGTPTPAGGTAVPMTDQPFLEMVYAILLFGVGGALVFNCGASSGGTDIIALILKKFTKMNTGAALLVIDCIVVAVSFYTFTTESILYSIIGLFAKSFLLDSVIESIGKTKYITIITTHPDEIGQYILDVIQHGYTKYDAQGGYTGEPKKVLVTVCKRGEALKLKVKVKEVDKEAFVILTDANEILGKGFGDTI